MSSVGATAQFTATANLSNGTTQTVTSQAAWSSSNLSVAAVTAAGVVAGVGPGNADITATYQGVSGTSHISVVPLVFTIGGLVTDGTSGGVLPGINVQVVDVDGSTRSTRTDAGGNYSIGGIPPGRATLTFSGTSYETATRTVTVSSDIRTDIVLARTLPDYAGVWTGTYRITSCENIDPPALTPLNLCAAFFRNQAYRFTLLQTGTTVTGTYNLTTPFFSCPCGGDYGTFTMSGTVAPDGSAAVLAQGTARGSGVQGLVTFNLRQPTSSTLVGTVSGSLNFGGVERARIRGEGVTGTR